MKINEELKEAVINVILNENRTINYEIHLFLLVSKLNRLKNFTLFHLTLRCNFFGFVVYTVVIAYVMDLREPLPNQYRHHHQLHLGHHSVICFLFPRKL